MHLVHPQKFVFNFSWDDCDTQEKFRGNNGQHAIFFFRWGDKVHYGLCKNGEFWIPRKPLRMGC